MNLSKLITAVGIMAATLCVLTMETARAQVTWTGASGMDTNWSTGGNWSGGTPPGAADSVIFGNDGTDATQGNVNNVVDATFSSSIASLTYANTNNFHATLIAGGQTLVDTGNLTVNTGAATDTQTIVATITGDGGALSMTGASSDLSAFQEASANDGHHATLDMSGLGMFTAAIDQILVGGSGGVRSSGTVYLAKTNAITLSAGSLAIDIGDAGGNNGGTGSLLYLGQINQMNVGSIVMGRGKTSHCRLMFNSAFGASAAVFRAADGVGRVGLWTMGDDTRSVTSGTPGSDQQTDLSGGTLDALVDTLVAGLGGQCYHGTSGPRVTSGAFIMDTGTLDVNDLSVGAAGVAPTGSHAGEDSGAGQGTLTVNGGTVIVNDALFFGQDKNGVNANTMLATHGALNMTNGTLLANSISAGAGSGASALNFDNCIVVVTNKLDTSAAAAGSTLSFNDSVLTFSVPPSGAAATVETLNLGGATNTINIAGISATITGYPMSLPIIQYTTLNGTFNVGTGNLVSPYTGYVSNDTANSEIVLVVTGGPPPARLLTWDGAPNGDWDTTTANWTFSGGNTSYNSGDSVIFDDSASGTTTVNLTGAMTPGSLTVSNETKDYGFGGSGYISGNTGIIKQGAGTLYITNSGINDYLGSLDIEAGTVQVGDGGSNGNLSSGAVTDNGVLAFNRSDTVTMADDISGSGAVTKQGTGLLELSGANSYDGATMVQSGMLKTSNGSALGSTNGATTISSGATLDVNGSNLGAEMVNISGAGDGNGVIINSGADQIHALQNVTLLGDTTIGGDHRWDIRNNGASQGSLSTGNQPYNLIKTGLNQISLIAVEVDTNLANVDVLQGTLSIETATTGLGNPADSLTVEAGATLQLYQLANPLDKVVNLYSDGSTITINNASGASAIAGPVTLNSDPCAIYANAGSSLALNGNVSGGSIYKAGDGNLIIGGNATESGALGGIYAVEGQVTLNGMHAGSIQCNYVTLPTVFAGTGTNNGATDLYGQLFPGDTNIVGTITLNGLTLESGATVGFDLGPDNAVGGTNNDLIQVNGDLTVNGNEVKINPMGILQLGVPYRFANYTGNLIWNGDLTVSGPNGQYIFTVDTNTPGQINLVASGGPPIWNGGSATDNYWTSADNWSGVTLNSGNSLIFAGTTRLNNTNDTADATTYSGITFDATAGAFTLNGNSITLTGPVGNSSTNNQTINLALTVNNNTTLDGGSGGLNLAGDFTNAAASGTQTLTLSGKGSMTDAIANNAGGQLTFLTTSSSDWTMRDNAASNVMSVPGELNIYDGGSFTFGSTNSAPDLTLVGADGTGSQRNLIGNANATSVVNMVSGNLTLQTRLNIGNGSAGATLNVSGGIMSVESSSISVADNGASTVGAVNISGGVLNTGPATNGAAHTFFVATRGTGTLNVSGTGHLVCGILDVSRNASSLGSTGTVNLDGGTVTANKISTATSSSGTGGAPTATFYFNGGVLQAGASSSTWFQGKTALPTLPITAIVKAGGAIVDSSTNNVTMLEPLLHDSTLGATNDGGLIKLGDGSVTLNASNTFVGPITVSAGTLTARNVNAFNGNPVTETVDGTTVYHNASGNFAGDYHILGNGVAESDGITHLGAIRMAQSGIELSGTITLLGDAGVSMRGSGTTGDTISGRITGPHGIEFGRTSTTTSAGTGTLILSSTANDWTGDTTVSDGTVKLGAAGVIPNGAGFGNLVLTNAGAAYNAGIADSVFDLNGFNETVNGLSDSGGVMGADLGKLIVTNSGAAATLTFGDSDASASFGGLIKGDVGVVKVGAGTQTLGGANSYTGDTTVNGGTLAIGQATLDASSTVAVAGGAMLQLNFAGVNHVAALVLNGVNQPDGVYDASTSPSFISGTGSLQVGSVTPPSPTITGITVSGTTLTLTATNGALNGQFVLYGSTNLALPLASWAPVLTNNFDGSGNLNLSTNIVDPNTQQEFFILVQ